MTELITGSRLFREAFSNLNQSLRAHYYQNRPHRLVSDISARLKEAAKYLAQGLGLPRSKALEALAVAGGFSSWHHLSAHLTKGESAEKGTLSDAWFSALAPLLVLLIESPPEVIPDLEVEQAYEVLASQLSHVLKVPSETLQDILCARMCGDVSWAALLNRTPLAAKLPLYRFVVSEHSGQGVFVASKACAALSEELDEQWPGGLLTKTSRNRVKKWLDTCLRLQPNFLEGWFTLAFVEDDARAHQALATVSHGVTLAEALIPKGFEGEISWGDLDNRFYLRMLFQQQLLLNKAQQYGAAVEVAEKLLRICPRDNLGVRYTAPLLLLSSGQYTTAKKACQALNDETSHSAAAIRAFVHYANGERAAFIQALLSGLFTLPWLRLFLTRSKGPLPEHDTGFRGVQPDLDTFCDFANPAYDAVPGLRREGLAVLANPWVIQAESELRAIWRGFWRNPAKVYSFEDWESARQKLTAEGVQRLK